MKNIYLFALLSGMILTGCSSTSTQYVEKPNLNSEIPMNKAIIELHRTSGFVGAAVGTHIYDNETKIGILNNDTKLTWERDSNSIMCLSRDKFGDDILDYLVNPMLTAALEPAHPDCFNIEAGKINKFKLIFSEARFINEKTWLKEYK